MINKKNIPRRIHNAVNARIESMIKKYGEDATRLLVNSYFNKLTQKNKAQKKIAELTEEITKLKKS